MKTTVMDIQDFGVVKNATRSEEFRAMKAMAPNTAMIMTDSKLQCRMKTRGGCSLQGAGAYLTKTHDDRLWSVKHVPEGHAIACFSK